MSISLRKATIADMKIIQNLNNELFEFEMNGNFSDANEYVENWAFEENTGRYFANLIENQFVYLAETGDQVVGFLIGSIYPEDCVSNVKGKTAELENMFIAKQYRNLGIGSMLEDAFIKWCKQQGVKRIVVTTETNNQDAISFYNKLGYKEKSVTFWKKI